MPVNAVTVRPRLTKTEADAEILNTSPIPTGIAPAATAVCTHPGLLEVGRSPP